MRSEQEVNIAVERYSDMILRKNPNTVYTHLRRAKELLKERLGGAADEE